MELRMWAEVYPQGTPEGDEEQAVFKVLSRHPKWQWRSVSALVKEASVTEKRVEEILYKYWKRKMVYQNPKDESQWGYWERVPEMVKAEELSIVDKDHEDRLRRAGVKI